MGRLYSVVSVLGEKRYWWEKVCNTAQMGGEDSAHDLNGCRVPSVRNGYCAEGLSSLVRKG